ncbi:MAG: DUF3089 domain-containing protein [Bacteroidetes bacterium]|nr:DUF3089 domain-containing protein [Bacteroidota bacterium]
MRITKTGLLIIVIAFISSCMASYKQALPDYQKKYNDAVDSVPDYTRLKYWAAHPALRDPSDSIPAGLSEVSGEQEADVFFLHPTTFTEKRKQFNLTNASIEDASINAKTDLTSILYQASVFNADCRVFAPRYRQAHIGMFYTADTSTAKEAFKLAYLDIKTAFEYYLERENNGRPIIIAAHSQGTLHAGRLLKEFFESKLLTSQLVVAYLWGMPLPPHYFSAIKYCSDSLATGCFTGWRLFKKGYYPDWVKKEKEISLVSNPITWQQDTNWIAPVHHVGSVLYDFQKLRANTQEAQIHHGIVWTNKPKVPFGFLYNPKNYHAGDINMFYGDIRKNIRARIKAFNRNKGIKKPQ